MLASTLPISGTLTPGQAQAVDDFQILIVESADIGNLDAEKVILVIALKSDSIPIEIEGEIGLIATYIRIIGHFLASADGFQHQANEAVVIVKRCVYGHSCRPFVRRAEIPRPHE